MTDQITVPRETWDAMREALKQIEWSNDSKWQADCARQAITAANAVSAEMVKLIPTAQEMGTPVQPQYSIDADPQGIRARVVSAVVGAMAYGASNTNKPPEGHWLNEVWDIARAEANRVQPQAQREIEEWLDANRMQKIGSLHHELVARFVAHPQATEPAWRPIESAPKDGTRILVFRPLANKSHDEVIDIKRGLDRNYGCWQHTVPNGCEPVNFTDGYCYPTHWMPLPAAPEAA